MRNSMLGVGKNDNILSKSDREFLSYLRGFSIFTVVLGHVGGYWIFKPYSEVLHVFIPVFFFISGTVSFYSFNRAATTISYYKKRFIGLLVPYCLLCILSLIVFVITQKALPAFNIANMLKWIQIRPSNDIMPFPVGQVWFLQCLFIISIFSPLYFILYQRHIKNIYLVILCIICFSVAQLFFNFSKYLCFYGNDFYTPIVYSIFYIFGMLLFSSATFRRKNILIFIVLFGTLFSIVSSYLLNLNIDYAFHILPPDLYYVSGGGVAISLILLFEEILLNIINRCSVIKIVLNFFNKHTFSIYLLHSFGIFLSERLLGMVDPNQKTIRYGLVKLGVVLIITCLFALPYTKISVIISSFLRTELKA